MVAKKKNAHKITLHLFFLHIYFTLGYKLFKVRHFIHLYILKVQHNSWLGEDTQKIINNGWFNTSYK